MKEFDTRLITAPTTSLRMEAIESGDGPLMVMLHGFPEMAESWRHQIKHFSKKGLKTVAPNMRGYGRTERPRGGYDVDTLAYDVAGILDHYGADDAVLVAHDWGGLVAWHFAYLFPNRLKALAILNAPHPVKFSLGLKKNPSQIKKSWYTLAFQLPILPELYLGSRGARAVGRIIQRSAVRKEAFSDDDLLTYSRNMSEPGALKAAIGYYRRALRDSRRLLEFYKDKKITAPTLVIWAQQDIFLGPELAEGLDQYIDAPLKVVPIENCGHWVNQEAPEEVNSAIDKFLEDI